MRGPHPFPYPPDDPADAADAAVRCRRLADRVAAAAASLRGDAGQLAGVWEGPAAGACRDELLHTASLAAGLAVPLHGAAAVLHGYRDALVDARARIDRLRAGYLEERERQERELGRRRADASIPAQLRRLAVDDLRVAQQLDLGAYHRRYAAILDELDAAARAAGRRLAALAAAVVPGGVPPGAHPGELEAALVTALPLLHAQRALVGRPEEAPDPATPAALVRAWWALLTADEQARLVGTRAAALGNLDGLPAAVRSRANERALGEMVARLEGRPHRSDDQQRWLDNCRLVRRQLDAARRAADPVTRQPVVVQLLVFDPRAFGGHGRAALAVGDLDTADHVAFLVPGMGSTLRQTLGRLADAAQTVTSESRRVAPAASTATVAWLGYDAPGWPAAVRDRAAEAGADLLVRDVLAVQAARDVVPHLTVVGHSYGSTTAGTALRGHVTGADDAVLLGSPGPGAEHARELRVPTGHVFVGANSRDPVSYLDRFGADPSHASFGAVRFRAEDPTRNAWRLDVADHGKYFAPRSESLANIVRIVVGDYEGVRAAPYREELRLLPDGLDADPEADRDPTDATP